jgi:hypothetical protein
VLLDRTQLVGIQLNKLLSEGSVFRDIDRLGRESDAAVKHSLAGLMRTFPGTFLSRMIATSVRKASSLNDRASLATAFAVGTATSLHGRPRPPFHPG